MSVGPMLQRNYALAAAATVAVIVHGSLFPYEFHARPGPEGAVETLLRSWADRPSGMSDLVANILLYVPFGFFASLALRTPAWVRFVVVMLAGAMLCTSMELLQFYDEGRVTSMSDAYLNTFGTVLGVLCGMALSTEGRLPLWRHVSANPVPAMLLAALVGYRLFPFVPTTDIHKYWNALKPVFIEPSVTPYLVFRYFALWLTASCLIGAVFGRGASRVIAPFGTGLVLAGKVMIVNLVLTPSELAGAAAALLAWQVLAGAPRVQAPLVAALLCTMVVAQRLEPFDFQAVPRAFTWLPFRSFLHGSMGVNTVSFLEKFFQYGSMLWLLARSGAPPRLATAIVACLLFVTSYGETYLPERSAEITDTVMALLIAGAIGVLDGYGPDRRTSSTPAPAASGSTW